MSIPQKYNNYNHMILAEKIYYLSLKRKEGRQEIAKEGRKEEAQASPYCCTWEYLHGSQDTINCSQLETVLPSRKHFTMS